MSAARVTRRNALRKIAYAVATLYASPELLAAEMSAVPPVIPARARPIFAPTRIASHGKQTRLCVDVHAHIFNASDIDAAGFMRKCVAHEESSPEMRHLMEQLAGVVGQLEKIAPDAVNETKELLIYLSKTAEMQVDQVKRFFESLAREHRKRVASALLEAMKAIGLDNEFLELQLRHIEQMRRTFGIKLDAVSQPSALDEAQMLRYLDPELRLADYERVFGTTKQPENSLYPGSKLEFAGHMLAYRWMNLRDYTRLYTEASQAFGVDAVFASYVNFDYWLAPAKRSPKQDQMNLHALLSEMSGGYMLPLIAYNPWADIKDQGETFELVKRAVLQYGFVGVKIYPPMGFYPYGNSKILNSTPEPRPDPKQLDRVLERLFYWCADNSVPVMAHSSESNGRDADSDEFGGPKGWDLLLKKFSNKTAKPVANVAHFGGGDTIAIHAPNSWPQQFAKLMKGSNGSRLYGDLGYWQTLLWCDSEHPGCDQAKARLKSAFKTNSGASSRLMFGTDWHMLSQEGAWNEYPKQLTANLSDVLTSMDAFFYQDALNCFGLVPGGTQRDRIVRRFAGSPGGVPRWL